MAAEERGISGVALVTDAARGIGFEAARQLAARRLAGEGLDARATTVDVADGESVRRLAAGVNEEFGRLDVLVNNAAAFADWAGTASSADLESSRAVPDTNLFGAWRVCQAFLPLIQRSEHGRVVNVSSGAGSHGESQFGLTTGGGAAASYGVSKAALRAGQLRRTEPDGHRAGDGGDGRPPRPGGAASVVWAAILPDGGATGGFFRDGESLPW